MQLRQMRASMPQQTNEYLSEKRVAAAQHRADQHAYKADASIDRAREYGRISAAILGRLDRPKAAFS